MYGINWAVLIRSNHYKLGPITDFLSSLSLSASQHKVAAWVRATEAPIHTPYFFLCMYMIYYTNPAPMEQLDTGGGVTKLAAVAACIGMAVFYVAILYSPTLILRLPPPDSFKSFLTRRFVCAAVSSVVSMTVAFLILPVSLLFVPYILCVIQFFYI